MRGEVAVDSSCQRLTRDIYSFSFVSLIRVVPLPTFQDLVFDLRVSAKMDCSLGTSIILIIDAEISRIYMRAAC